METTTVTISVTQRHIDNGERCNFDTDAVALAIREAVPGSTPKVFGNFIHFDPDFRVDTPDQVGEFIDAFDNGDSVQPITFPLDIPTRLLTQGSQA